jgi:hypothetical protein
LFFLLHVAAAVAALPELGKNGWALCSHAAVKLLVLLLKNSHDCF